jgi:hypothetical protein
MLSTIKNSTRRITRFNPAMLRDSLAKIQSNWQTSDRRERAVLAQARQLQLLKLSGLLGG